MTSKKVKLPTFRFDMCLKTNGLEMAIWKQQKKTNNVFTITSVVFTARDN